MLEPSYPINSTFNLLLKDIEFTAVRAQGAGGQHVNKVSTAIHLRFDIVKSSLPDIYKERLTNYNDQRITSDGIIVIKSQQTRSQEMNKMAAIEKLIQLIQIVNKPRKQRRDTKPTKASITRRLEQKNNRKQVKKTRQKITY